MIEKMKQWLEAFDDRSSLLKWQAAREALRQAIAELESQEPVAKLKTSNVLLRCHRCGFSDKLTMQIEYIHPPQRIEPIQSLQCFHCQVTIETLNDKVMHLLAERKPLTNDEIQQIVLTAHGKQDWTLVFARAIEAAHGIKENT
jgi:predicted Zn-ribbon and HTH transcriptional regulator